MHVVDIGATLGFYTLLLADLVGPTGRVTTFEAQPALFDILGRNVELNGFQDRTTLVQKVVHEAAGIYPFASFDRYGTGGREPRRPGPDPGLRGTRVPGQAGPHATGGGSGWTSTSGGARGRGSI